MIQMQTKLAVADNSGAKRVMCIKVLGGSHRRFAYVGDTIKVAIQEVESRQDGGAKVKKGDVVSAVIVRQKYKIRRNDGSYISFDQNAVVLLNNAGAPVGTRVFGPVAGELRGDKFGRIVSLAPEVL